MKNAIVNEYAKLLDYNAADREVREALRKRIQAKDICKECNDRIT